MPTVTNLLTGLGFKKGAGSDFYLPSNHPHVHVRVANASKSVPDMNAVHSQIEFISLSWGGMEGGQRTINLYRREAPYETLETRSFSRDKKLRFESGLYNHILADTRLTMQTALNKLTSMGVDAC